MPFCICDCGGGGSPCRVRRVLCLGCKLSSLCVLNDLGDPAGIVIGILRHHTFRICFFDDISLVVVLLLCDDGVLTDGVAAVLHGRIYDGCCLNAFFVIQGQGYFPVCLSCLRAVAVCRYLVAALVIGVIRIEASCLFPHYLPVFVVVFFGRSSSVWVALLFDVRIFHSTLFYPVLNGHIAVGIVCLVSDGVSLCDLALHDAVDGVVPVLVGDPCRVRLFYDCTVAVIGRGTCLGLSVQRHSRLRSSS